MGCTVDNDGEDDHDENSSFPCDGDKMNFRSAESKDNECQLWSVANALLMLSSWRNIYSLKVPLQYIRVKSL